MTTTTRRQGEATHVTAPPPARDRVAAGDRRQSARQQDRQSAQQQDRRAARQQDRRAAPQRDRRAGQRGEGQRQEEAPRQGEAARRRGAARLGGAARQPAATRLGGAALLAGQRVRSQAPESINGSGHVPSAAPPRPARPKRSTGRGGRGRPTGPMGPTGPTGPAQLTSPAHPTGPTRAPGARPHGGSAVTSGLQLHASAAQGTVRIRAGRRQPFVFLVVGLLSGGLVCLLLLNTVLAAGAFQTMSLQQSNATLARQQQELQQEVAEAESPSAIAQRARQLGMVPVSQPRFVNLKSGRIYGGTPALVSRTGN
ncbi:MAG TPA: hypothetical protein VLW50_22585 [Streptosporangiaceae bacterium]|nr:hypothetical protein [Streptosporangiaceae bacterium]